MAVAALAGGLYFFNNQPAGQVACTMEAKLCSDGSYVGRQGPPSHKALDGQGKDVRMFRNYSYE